MSKRLEEGTKVYTRRRMCNTLLPDTRTTSHGMQMQQSQNQMEEHHCGETTNERQHMHQEINCPISGNPVTGDCSTTIACTTIHITLGNPRDDELLHGLRRLTHVRRLARSLRQQTNATGDNPNSDGSTTTSSTTTRITLGNERDDSLLNGLRRLTHMRRLARSLRHGQTTTLENNPNVGNAHDDSILSGLHQLSGNSLEYSHSLESSWTKSSSSTVEGTLPNVWAQAEAQAEVEAQAQVQAQMTTMMDVPEIELLARMQRFARNLRQQSNVGGANPNSSEECI